MLKVLKKIILIIGLMTVFIVLLMNIIFTAKISRDEFISVGVNSFISLLATALISLAIYLVCGLLEKKQIKIGIQQILFVILLLIYLVVQVVFICGKQEIKPQADQSTTYIFAITMKNGTIEQEINNGKMFDGVSTNRDYAERYKQQLTLAFVWQILFRIFNTDKFVLVEIFNVLGNFLTLFSIVFICEEFAKKYNINKYLATILTVTFVSLIYLITFVYGDISGLGFAMLGVYFIIKYGSSKRWYFALLSALCCGFAYMLRMNFLIFILAILIYLFLDLIDKKSYSEIEKKVKIKDIIKRIVVILCFTVIVFVPTKIIENYYCKKLNLSNNKPFQLTGYLYMGMSESALGPGWYRYDYAKSSFTDYEHSTQEFKDGIKERVGYFLHNPKEAVKFYTKKICSMWAENTYASTFYNKVYDKDEGLENKTETVIIRLYQKALIFIIFGCTFVALLQKRKNLSNEVLLLLTIFIGGFLFHILWEAKSRYIIPYIIVLIPIASIELNKIKLGDILKKINNVIKR